MVYLCRDCSSIWSTFDFYQSSQPSVVCPNCYSVRVLCHKELMSLDIAHIDCDAFYASVEKRDDPRLSGKPVIVGGGNRGVVAACCYIARIRGVRSAMPMFQAKKRCPEAVVIPPNMKKYKVIASQIRKIMKNYTPMVEPLSIDEAFLDLSGTDQIHGGCPAQTLVTLAAKIEQEIGITVSIGLSYNKFLAKISSDLDKPRGYSIIGQEEAESFLKLQPVSIIWGVGAALKNKLRKDGIKTVGDLKKYKETELVYRYGKIGSRLQKFSKGIDKRRVSTKSNFKSMSAENTFDKDLSTLADLSKELWVLAERVSGRLKKTKLVCLTVVLKLRKTNFKVLSRSKTLSNPTQMAEEIYKNGLHLLKKEVNGQPFRLIGISAINLNSAADPVSSLDMEQDKERKVEEAIDNVRNRFGEKYIVKGRVL